MSPPFSEATGQGWAQIADLAVAFALSAVVGLEREMKQKAAGVRTYTVVGFASALFMLVSKYGFTDLLSSGRVALDPSRVAAQIVSGVGFIGGGIIFVRRDAVRGLTTAASVWLTAAIGAAAGAGLPVLAVAGTAGYFVTIGVLPQVARQTVGRFGIPWPMLRVYYVEGGGWLRQILETVTRAGFMVADIDTAHEPSDGGADGRDRSLIVARMQLNGKGDFEGLVGRVAELDGVVAVSDVGDTEAY